MDDQVSCGIDIEEIYRFSKFISFPGKIEPFIHSVFTSGEIEHSLKFGKLLPFALGFSCKEAFFKALGISWTNSAIKWQDVEIFFENRLDISKYEVKLGGYAKTAFKKQGFNHFETFIDYNDSYVVFKVVFSKKLVRES